MRDVGEAVIMADDVIFVRQGGELVALAVAPYEAEAVLQELLEHYPQLLAGYQMRRSDPRRFLLVCREAPVADQYGAGRWSLDHLFVDQDAVPTFVEVKRSSDTRIRREVVGQMLDYAANGTRYWGDGTLAQLFERACADIGRDPAAALQEVAGQDADAQEFWDQAERNLRNGTVRLMFVADVIPDELATVIEFLNTQMHDTEIYGVEVRRYGSGEAAECFVPRLIGATAAAQAEKRSPTSLNEKLQSSEPEVLIAAERLRFLAEEIGLPLKSTPASLRITDSLGSLVLLYPTYRTVEFPLEVLYRAGRQAEISHVLETLQRIAGTSKKVSAKSPNVGVREALEHWDTITETTQELNS